MFGWQGVSEFVEVAKKQSFTHAAIQLGVSTAQVSRQITQLEQRLGTKLFYRTTRKVRLTPEGQIYFDHCFHLVNGLEEAERALGNLKAAPQGLVRLTAPVAYGEMFIMPLINQFMLRFPAIEIEVMLTNEPLDLISGGFDLAIRVGELADSTDIARPISQRINYTCASPEYLHHNGQPTTIQSLSQHNCLVGSRDTWRFNDKGKQHILTVQGNYRCNSGRVLRDAAINGLGIVQLPDYYVEADIGRGRLIALLDEYADRSDKIWALYPQNRHLSVNIRFLVDYLCEQLNEYQS